MSSSSGFYLLPHDLHHSVRTHLRSFASLPIWPICVCTFWFSAHLTLYPQSRIAIKSQYRTFCIIFITYALLVYRVLYTIQNTFCYFLTLVPFEPSKRLCIALDLPRTSHACAQAKASQIQVKLGKAISSICGRISSGGYIACEEEVQFKLNGDDLDRSQ